MEERKVNRLKKELALKKFQFNAIYEFSESIYSSFNVDNITRIYFSTLMGQLGVARIFFVDSEHKLFKKRGFQATEAEIEALHKDTENMDPQWFSMDVDELGPENERLKSFLTSKKILHLVNIAESKKNRAILGLGEKLNRQELKTENIEYAFFVSKFSLSAIENAILVNRLIETKRMEHELKIAKDIQ
ncbi:MAG: hypothetical protein GY940_22955 [bacterium]|nr:hypothetical protein [bacterium]